MKVPSRVAAVEAGMARVRIRLMNMNGDRLSYPVTVRSDTGDILGVGGSRDERFDSNDHLEFILPLGQSCHLEVSGVDPVPVEVTEDEQLITVTITNDPIRSEDQ